MERFKVKIIDTRDLYLKDEERAINEGIHELLSADSEYHIAISKLVYRQNSVIIEYYQYKQDEDIDNETY